MIFDHYARYYDLLYQDKDYAAECDFVTRLIGEFAPGAARILDLGCGTGRHCRLLAERGFEVHGVDQSCQMLAAAQAATDNPSLTFSCGDIRTVRLNREFDVAVSLFHVMSYQTGNDDLLDACTTAWSHLCQGGIFLFDCWYGPAVLTDRPGIRVKRLSDPDIDVTRIAEPKMHPGINVVDVNYQVMIRDKSTNILHELTEEHRMRYLFEPEMQAILKTAGFSMVECAEWLTRRSPDFSSWNVYFVCRK